jgi:hypothetical protein
MIQPASENKYRFDMLVSARAMGSHALSSKLGLRRRRDRFSKYLINGLRWSAPIAAAARSHGAMGRFSRIRDPTTQALSTDDRTDNLRQ